MVYQKKKKKKKKFCNIIEFVSVQAFFYIHTHYRNCFLCQYGLLKPASSSPCICF